MSHLRDWVSLTKPRVTQGVVFTMAAGVCVAPGHAWTLRTALAMLGCVMLVASANTLNCWWERDSDLLMGRTSARALPQGRLLPWHALMLGMVLWSVSIPLLYAAANAVTAALGLVAHAVYVGLYTPLKRHTAWSTLVGFVPGAMPPLMGCTAVTGALEPAGVLLFALMLIWQLPHTLAIGLLRGQEYAQAGIHVIPNTVGEMAAKRHILGGALVLWPVSLALWGLGGAGVIYAAACVVMGAAFVGLAWQGLRAAAGTAWQKRVFYFSIAYLATVLLALGVDRAV